MTPSGRPLLLLDVDGVLNPYGTDGTPPALPGYTPHHLFPGDEPVLVNPVHGSWILELSAIFDVVWASGWGQEANTHLAPLLGIEALPLVPLPSKPFPPEAKAPAVAAYVLDRPVVWVDDVMTEQARLWADRRATPTLLIAVDPATGWTRGHVDRAVHWNFTR